LRSNPGLELANAFGVKAMRPSNVPTTLLLFIGLSLLQLGVGAFVVGLIDRRIRIVVLRTKYTCFVVKRFCEIDSPAAFIGFSKTVVNVC
jgi:hypothetical protein